MQQRKSEKIWVEHYQFGDPTTDAAIRDMAKALGRSELFSVLLYNRGYHTAEEAEGFLRFAEHDLHDPYLFADMEKAVERILLAVHNNEKICVYGDYDVDGVTAASLFYLYLKRLGARVNVKIPKRDGEGYGVSCAAVKSLADSGTNLIITVDTGITANAEVEYAKNLGIDFVVTDHHECRSDLPNACAVVNPHRPDCPYPFKELAGVGVVFKVVCACESRRCRDLGESIIDGVRRVCLDYIDLVALGTIADVMPVVDENRLIVSLGLHLMEHGSRPGLEALIEASTARKNGEESKKRKMTSSFVGFGLAPRINAAGRISDAAIAVRLLLCEDPEKAKEYAEELCAINRKRQIEENRIANEAYEKIDEAVSQDDSVIVLDSNVWQQGIIGIVSSKITEHYGLPSILISFDGSYDGKEESPFDDGKGSGRSIKGMNLVEALNSCEDLLVKYGGHELAAGLTVKRANLEEFRKRINEYARTHLSEDDYKIRLDADCEISMQDMTLDFAKEIQMLEPCGTGNPTPLFVLRNATVRRITHTRGGEHARLLLERDGICITGMYFGMTAMQLGFESGDQVDVLFNLDINDYKNVLSVQMIIRDAHLAGEFVHYMSEQKKRYAELRAGGSFLEEENIIPVREEFARVYQGLRREFRSGHTVISQKDLLKLVNASAEAPISYVKLKYILEIFKELQLCEIDEVNPDLYQFEIVFRASKTDIEKSCILKKLKTQCIDRGRREGASV